MFSKGEGETVLLSFTHKSAPKSLQTFGGTLFFILISGFAQDLSYSL